MPPERRFNPLNNSYVLVSPHRTLRPWHGQVEDDARTPMPEYDAKCYLCPGNTRASGDKNEAYEDVYWFTNDFPALLPPSEEQDEYDPDGLFVAKAEAGTCRVVCFSPKHNLKLADMDVTAIRKVVECWTQQYRELIATSHIHHVQIFENRGAMMGCSNQHPHCQIWAQDSVPMEVQREIEATKKWSCDHGDKCLLCTYVGREKTRVVSTHGIWTVLVPFWAVWPFETMILPIKHVSNLNNLCDDEKDDFAAAFSDITSRYERVFSAPWPYSMGIHQLENASFHMHVHFYPPLLRSATVKKFMVGYELLAEPQRDLTPESAAEVLRGV